MRHAKPQPIRNKIDLADPSQIRILRRRLGISADDLQRVVEKVGNSIAAVCKEIEPQNASGNRTDAGPNRIPVAIGSWSGRVGGLVCFGILRVHRLEDAKPVSIAPVVRSGRRRPPAIVLKPRFGDCHEETYHLHRCSRTCLFVLPPRLRDASRGRSLGCRGFGRAGHGKVGAVAGCVIGHHEANKADVENAKDRLRSLPQEATAKISG